MLDASAHPTDSPESAPDSPERADTTPHLTIGVAALVLGIASDILLYRHKQGINVPIFTALILLALIPVYRRDPRATPIMRNLWLVAAILFFATMTCLRAESFLAFMNASAAFLLMGVLFVILGTNRIERLTVVAYAWISALWCMLPFFQAAPTLGHLVSRISLRREGMQPIWRVLLGLVIAGPFLIVFIVLFSAADAVFERGVSTILRLEFLKQIPDFVGHLVWIFFVAWGAAGALALSVHRAHTPASSRSLEVPSGPWFRLGFIEAATVLAAVNALFLIFVSIQFTYLFGGAANVEGAGLTYAEYARRGFFELCAVAIVTMGMLLGLEWLGRREGYRAIATFNGLCYALVALVLVIIVSAFQRMSLYEEIYGFTSLRVYTHWFMVWMGVVFALKAVAIWLRNGRVFAFGGLLSMTISLAAFNIFNPDAFIAEQNLKRYVATGSFGAQSDGSGSSRRSTRLDSDHILSLSYDATPVIAAYLDQLRPAEQSQVGGVLRLQLDVLEGEMQARSWQAYHPAVHRAYLALKEHEDLLKQYPPRRSS